MSVEIGEGSGEVEDELIDLNKEPVERKRKRVEKKISTDKVNEGPDSLPKSGRVLRSRTVAMSDGEKRVIEMEIVKMDDKDESEVLLMEDQDEIKVPVAKKRKKMKGRRGRPPKNEGKCEVSPLSPPKKRGRGRPPKTEGKCVVSSPNFRKKEDKITGLKKVVVDVNGDGRGRRGPKVKRRGRPPKVENGSTGLVMKKKNMNRNSGHKNDNGGPVKRLKVGKSDLANDVSKPRKTNLKCTEGMEMGLREQKQLVRDKIVAMLKKAGWSIEYRQRQSKDYQDAVYVDREGRGYWSVTLAYKKFKERIDTGEANDKDVLAFSPIPEETLSMLFRITQKGAKGGKKKKNSAGKMKKKESTKGKSIDGRVKSRLNRGKQRTLLARRPREGSDGDDYELYEGKRSLLSWMIDLGTVPLGGKVKYKRPRSKKILLEGKIVKEGIICDCCSITHTILDFESHAKSTLGKPYQNIYLDSGNSLFQCLVDSWKKHVETDNIGYVSVDVEGDDPNDDTCNLCGDGGDLICCDSCPSTFHHGCLRIKVPSGDWHCVYCTCKFCGMACGSTSTTDDDLGLSSEIFTCCLCEEKFHLHCVKGTIAEDSDEENLSFCGKECSKIFGQLRSLLGVRQELEKGFSYTVLRHSVVTGDASSDGDSLNVESNSKLAVAFFVMDECFEPIIDERSGTNMIHNVVYSCGSNIRRLNYDGFYTIILEKGDEVISAASIRIHGSQLAEMPFIGTRFVHRRKGMCSQLLAAAEMFLCSLGVEKLVIPAISELNETWTKVFGFVPVEESKRQEMRRMSMIVFPGVDMLEKPLSEHQFINGPIDSAATECTEVRAEHQNTRENSESDSNTSSDVKKQEDINEADADKSTENACNNASASESTKIQTHDASASESTKVQTHDASTSESTKVQTHDASVSASAKVQTHDQNTQDERSEDVTGPSAPDLDLSNQNTQDERSEDVTGPSAPDLDLSNQNTQDERSEDIAGPSEPDLDLSAEIEAHNDDKDTAPFESVTTVNNVGESNDSGKCLNCLNTSLDNNFFSKANGSVDCNLEAQPCGEEMNSCPNGVLSENGNIVNGDRHDDIVLEGDLKESLRDRSDVSIGETGSLL